MNPLLTAVGLALAVILSSASAYAETQYAYGVPNEQGGFDFFDNRLDGGSKSGFASIVEGYKITINFDASIPYIFNPTTAAFIQEYWSTYPHGGYFNSKYIVNPRYNDNYEIIGADYSLTSNYSGFDQRYEYSRIEYYENTDYLQIKSEEIYSRGGFGIRKYIRGEEGYTDVSYEEFAERMEFDSRAPMSDLNIIDFENSLIYFSDASEGISLQTILFGHTIDGIPIDFFGRIYTISNIPGEQYFSVQFNFPPLGVVTGMTLAYNLPIPEPETWAMLLAGLGIVGAVTRRQRTKAAIQVRPRERNDNVPYFTQCGTHMTHPSLRPQA